MRLQLPLSREMNIVLVGMPGAGKSTVGVVLAKRAARGFVDSDLLIEVREGMLLQEILDRSDYLNLRRIEEEILLSLDVRNHVIATGGSAAYSSTAMQHLGNNGAVVFLDVGFEEVVRRVHNLDTRGIACRPGLTLREIYEERRPLYLKWADIRIECGWMGHEAVARRVMQELGIKGRY
jgi:shikimate kinase